MIRKIKLNKKKGILFWITGLSGSGKTTIAKKISKKITRLYGPTLEISGDEFREAFKINKSSDFSHKSRLNNLWKYHEFCKLVTDKKINLIFSIMGLYNKARNWNRKNIENYIEIYIETDIKKIMKQKKKENHLLKKKNIVGYDIKAELPKKPHIKIVNNFNKNLEKISEELLVKIKKIIKKN
jgi:adenylylsulfate kinase